MNLYYDKIDEVCTEEVFMFGYVKPCVPFLTVAEYEAYKAVYCGLCREMGKVTGQLSRMALSYDFAFLAFLRMAIEKTPSEFDKNSCIAHPFKKKLFVKTNPSLTYCAEAFALLTAAKTLDDISDEKGFKKLCAKTVYPFEKRTVSKLDKCLFSLEKRLSSHLERLRAIEKSKTASIDEPSAVFGELLGDICAFGYEGANERIAREIGKSVGKIIYVLDAADDLFDDIKDEKYNPIALVYKDIFSKYSKEKANALPSDISEALMSGIGLELSKARSALALLDTEECEIYEKILLNILSSGLLKEAERVFSGKKNYDNPIKHKI